MTHNKLFFSVICPTYNSESFIEKNILSLLNQTYQNFEIIYSDDGSTDQTVNILKKYEKYFIEKKINFKILKNSHKGPGAARNQAIKSSNYEWISFIDSDDQWVEKKLEKVFESIEKFKDCNCVVHNEIFKKKNGSEIYYNYNAKFKKHKSIYSQLFLNNFLSTSSVSLKKSLIIKAKFFDEELLNAQDYDLWLKIGDNFNFHFINEYLGFYNERKNNITSKSYKERVLNLIKIIKRNNKKVSRLNYYYKYFRILVNKEWFK